MVLGVQQFQFGCFLLKKVDFIIKLSSNSIMKLYSNNYSHKTLIHAKGLARVVVKWELLLHKIVLKGVIPLKWCHNYYV